MSYEEWGTSAIRSVYTIVGPLAVGHIRFTTMSELNVDPSCEAALERDRLLCLGELQGHIEMIRVGYGFPSVTCIFDRFTYIYDGRTGNLLSTKSHTVEEIPWPAPEGPHGLPGT